MTDTHTLIACHDCDLLHRVSLVHPGMSAKCHRCGAVLYKDKPDSLARTLALVLAGSILFLIANSFPFLDLEMQGNRVETILLTGIVELFRQGLWDLGLLVMITTVLVPAVQLSCLLYLLVPLRYGVVPWRTATVFRFVKSVQPWGMMEVFLLGVLVSTVKLAGMAKIVPGIAIWAFAALIFVLAGATVALNPDEIWRRVRIRR